MTINLSILLAFAFILSGCGGSSGGSSAVTATAAESKELFGAVAGLSKIGEFVDYADTRQSTGNLTPEQEVLLQNCVKSESSTGDSSSTEFTGSILVSGMGCPLSYNMQSSGSVAGDRINAQMQVNYLVTNSNFASITDTQSVNCTGSLSGTTGENSNLSGQFNCSINSKKHGAVGVSMSLRVAGTPSSSQVSVNAVVTAGGKVVNVSISLVSNSQGTTSDVRINGVPSDDASDLSALSTLFSF